MVHSNDGGTQTSKSKKSRRSCRKHDTDCLPVYSIDLSLPPEERYKVICKDYKKEIAQLVLLYDEVLQITPYPRLYGFLARHLLKRVFSEEETREIRGISHVTGVPLNLVIAFNTFLDLFSGCTSGGARVSDAGSDRRRMGIVHFRGLDWDMESLRKMIISVEYMRGGEVIARGVTYAGYVGVLTGVRLGLSMSMNYRTRLGSSHRMYKHRWHQFLVLLGIRPSIPSHLRSLLLSDSPPPTLTNIRSLMSKTPTSPCYLTFCTPDEVMVIESDLADPIIEASSSFLTVTNNDRRMESWDSSKWAQLVEEDEKSTHTDQLGISGILKDSIERRTCVEQFWEADSASNVASSRIKRRSSPHVEVADVQNWMQSYPICNEATHFSCIMDPSVVGGRIIWLKSYLEPPSNGKSGKTLNRM
ncbi:hypothetical protein P691DRAFT_808635 [Macrolepiota fuliginosa MF-IS2]|uniref:ceramidase n=1 Tax=Macrolepiota fuliginosa MF-IS2 TaxID=1400762 RepID=A0A9P5XK06_9AGAR|nr:hypothetical protein P691DRAFT_808635 [Macrolepiota fuliginosa MF-IS2]